MARIVLTDGSARWFESSKAEHFDEDTYWDGNNICSKATGSRWEHETLYRTAGKQWVLHHTSSWQGAQDTWTMIDDDEAARWLVTNGLEHPDVEAEIANLEIK